MTLAPTRLDVAVEVAAFRAELAVHTDPTYEAEMRRVIPSALPSHFVRKADLRRIGADWSRAHRDASPEDLIELADALMAVGWREESIVAMIVLSRSKLALQTLPWSRIEDWSSRFENWEHVDNAAMLVTAKMLAIRAGLLDDVETMAASSHVWQRRLAIVTLIEATRHDPRWRPHLEAMAQRLTGDKGPTMRKAVAWARKVVSETEGQIA